MQTIVKIIIALLFSHFTVSESPKEKKEEVAKALSTFALDSNQCATLKTTPSVSSYYII